MLAVIAALPREIAGLVRGIPADATLRARGVHLFRLPGAVIVAAGMGGERATLAIASALDCGGVDTLLSVGLAGACLPQIRPGCVVEAALVVDVRTGEKFETDASGPEAPGSDALDSDAPGSNEHRIVLATSTGIATLREKARLAATYDAAMVDMEAATVARLARAQGLRFRAIKAISDAHDFELASLARFEGRQGTFRTGRFALHTALRPHHWRKTAALGRHSTQALAALQQELRTWIEPR